MTIRPGLRRACRFAAGRRAAAALLLAVATGVAVRAAVARRYTPLASDSVHYVLLARALAAGEGFVSGGSQHPDLSRSPMLPLLAAVVTKAAGVGALAAGRFVVLVTSALLVVPLFFLTRRLFGPLAGLASLPLGVFSCLLGTAIHVMPAAPYLLFALGAIAAVWSAGRRRRVRILALAGSGALAGGAAMTRSEGLIVAAAVTGWAGLDTLVRPGRGKWGRMRATRSERTNSGAPPRSDEESAGERPGLRAPARPSSSSLEAGTWPSPHRARGAIASSLVVAAAAAAVYAPYAVWASSRLGRLSPVPGMQYLSDMRTVCDRLSLREMDGPDLPWSERATYVVSADRASRVLETWFDTRVMLPPAATFSVVSGSADGPAPVPETPTLAGIGLRRLRIVAESVRNLPWVIRDGHFMPPVPVLLGIVGIVVAIARPSKRRAVVFLALMTAATLAPILSHVEARFLYAPFALGIAAAAYGWSWIAARVLAAAESPRSGGARGLSAIAAISLVLAAGVALSGARHTDGIVEPPAREALHRALGADVARLAGAGPVLAIQSNVPFWAGRPYRPIPVGPASVVLDYARAQGASCLVMEGDRDLARRPELQPLFEDPPPAGYTQVLSRPAPQGGELRVFRIEPASQTHRAGAAGQDAPTATQGAPTAALGAPTVGQGAPTARPARQRAGSSAGAASPMPESRTP